MLIAGLAIAGIGLLAAIAFGIWNLRLSYKELYLSRRELEEQNHIAKGISGLAKSTLKAIERDGVESRKTIERDGHETRQAIRDVHKSIKEELIEKSG